MIPFDPAQWTPAPDQVTAWIVPAGAILAVALIGLLWWQVRHRSLASVGRAITTPLVLAWEAQGLHHLAEKTGVKGVAAWVLALVTSAVLVTLAAYADDHHKKHGNLGWPGRLVWIVAVPMGLVVALTAMSAAEFALRIILPLLVALVWWVPYAPAIIRRVTADGTQALRTGALRISPRRIGVWLGLIDPTDADLSVVHEERQIRRLTTAAHKLHHGWRLWRPMRAARLRRLALVATPEMVDEVARRVRLVHEIERLTSPVKAAAPEGTDAAAGARAEPTAEPQDARAEATAPDDSARAEHSAPAPSMRAGGPRRPSPRLRSARAAAPTAAASARAQAGADDRAEDQQTDAGARAETAYAQYAAHVEEAGAEPDGAMVAGWLGYAHAGNGRKAREPWRARMAKEIETGARARPVNLPGAVAALLPPESRTRAPETSAPAADGALDAAGAQTDDILGALSLDSEPGAAAPVEEATPIPEVATA
ncbi:hypothetical protein ABZ671_18430 [Micromonospora sp. NPDC006766]|uniref:hypothetical protein n=1 Tax=Micromonospora sp. NPDC006766 TaxID=3154778 RepID=UPI0033E7F7D7